MLNEFLYLVLSGTAGILIIGFLGKALEKKTSITYIIWLILFGILLSSFGVLKRSSLISNLPYVVNIVLILTLFNAGLNIKLRKVIKTIPRALILSLTNFTLSFIVTFLISYLITSNLLFSSLFGFSVAGVSFYIISSLKENLSQKGSDLSNIEGTVEEPLAIVFVIVLLSGILLHNTSAAYVAEAVIAEFAIGAVLGTILGMIWVPIMGKLQKEKYDYSYVASLAMAFIVYLIISLINGSGLIGVLSFGIVIANGQEIFHAIKYRHNPAFNISEESKSFNDLVTFLTNSLFFVYFGALIILTDYFGLIFGLSIGLILVAIKALSSRIALYKSAYTPNDKRSIGILAARGTGTAIAAALPLSYNLMNGSVLIDAAFSVIIVTVFMSMFIGNSKRKWKA